MTLMSAQFNLFGEACAARTGLDRSREYDLTASAVRYGLSSLRD